MANEIRIINKSKDSVIIKYANRKQQTLTWDQFNSIYVIKDKVWAELKPEAKAKYEKAEKLINDAIVAYFSCQSTNPKLTILGYLELGTTVNDLATVLDCTPAEAIKLIQSRLVSFKAKFGTQHREYKPSSTPRVFSTSNNKVATFGDLPELQKLKAKMEGK